VGRQVAVVAIVGEFLTEAVGIVEVCPGIAVVVALLAIAVVGVVWPAIVDVGAVWLAIVVVVEA